MSLGGAHLCSSSGERRTRLLLSSAPSTSCLDGRGGGEGGLVQRYSAPSAAVSPTAVPPH